MPDVIAPLHGNELIMGVDLTNDLGGYFGCSGTAWLVYRTVAEEFGWSPSGPRYDSSGRMCYGERDAASLHDAIDLALRSDLLPEALRRAWQVEWAADVWLLRMERDKADLIRLQEFCRAGAFRASL